MLAHSYLEEIQFILQARYLIKVYHRLLATLEWDQAASPEAHKE
jgi:hypothetical protein